MLHYSTHFLFISSIIGKIFHFILSDQLEKVFSVFTIHSHMTWNGNYGMQSLGNQNHK